MSKTTLVFDLDGTIVHSAPDLGNAINHVLVALGKNPLSVAEVQSMIGNGMPKLLQRGFAARHVKVTESEFEQHYDEFCNFYTENCCIDTAFYPGAVEMLEKVRADGYLTAICTNKLEPVTKIIMDQMDLTRLFDGIVGAEPPRPRKPDADPVFLAIERAGGSRDNAIMIGDSPADIGAGMAANLPTIAVSYGYTNVPPGELGADILIDFLSEVPVAVSKIQQTVMAN
jgi:phosphoglycolate phosphatase